MGHTKSMFVQKKSNKDEQWNWLIITYNNDIAFVRAATNTSLSEKSWSLYSKNSQGEMIQRTFMFCNQFYSGLARSKSGKYFRRPEMSGNSETQLYFRKDIIIALFS